MEGIKELLKKHLKEHYTEEIGDAFNAEVDGLIGKSFVSRSDFNAKNSELKELKKKMDDEKMKGATDEELKKQIEELKASHAQELAMLADKRHHSALMRAIQAAGAKNPKAVKALLDESKLKYSDDEDAVEGLKEQLEALNQSDGYLFDTPAHRAPEGTGGAGNGNVSPKSRAGENREVPAVI